MVTIDRAGTCMPFRVASLSSRFQPLRLTAFRGPVINHGNAGNQTKDPASATISKESGGLPHGKPREAPRKLRKIPRKFREFWWNFWVSSSVRRALFQARLVM